MSATISILWPIIVIVKKLKKALVSLFDWDLEFTAPQCRGGGGG